MEPLRIHLLGGFLLERGGVSLPPIASLRGRSLLAYLATHKGRPVQRDLLAGMFWPDSPEGRARRRLSHTLWQIQDVVNTTSHSYISAHSHTVQLDTKAPHWLDTEEFDENFALTASHSRPDRGARLRRCVDLYRGDFMAGHFDDWVVVEQDIYRQRFLISLQRLIGVSKAAGAYDEALDYAIRLTHHDSLNEEAHREVMRLNVLLGRTSQAVEQYERVRSVLEDEIGTEPSPATVDIYEKILRQRRSGIHPPLTSKPAMLLGGSTEAPFVGRDEERRLVIDAMDSVMGGSGGVVLVEGEPGVGKTRLAFELAEDARWRGFEVSWGTCSPGAVRPFGPLVDVLGSLNPLRVEQLGEQIEPVWLGEAGRIAPLHGHGDNSSKVSLKPSEQSERMIEALVKTLEALGRLSPHLIFIDDIHWADRDTLHVLRQAANRLEESQILLVLIFRSEEARGDPDVWETLRDLDKKSGLGRAVLSPLSVFELDRMVKRILGASRVESSISANLHRQTGGNVLFTIETLLAMRDEGLFESDLDPASVLANHIEDREVPVAPRVRSIIQSRLSLLSEEVAYVFRAVCLIGHRITVELLEIVTDHNRQVVLHALDELLYRGLIRDEGDGRYQVAHDQIRQVVYESTRGEQKKQLHLQVAEAISTIDPKHVEAIGHHFRSGGNHAKATHYLSAAGAKAVEMSAFSTARHQLAAAVETSKHVNLSEQELYDLRGRLFDVLNVLGRREEQHEVLEEMAALSAALETMEGDVARRRAWLLAQEAELAEAEASAELAVQHEARTGDSQALATSLIALGTIRRWSGRPLDAIDPLANAVELSHGGRGRADALSELASTFVEVQRVDEALARLDSAREIFDQLEDLRGQAEVEGIKARAFRQAGDSERSADLYEKAIQLCRHIGYRHGEALNLTNLSNLHQLVGSVAHSLSGYDQAARIFREMGNRRGEAMVLANSASARHSVLGDDDRALEDATKAMGYFEVIGDRARRAQCLEVIAGTKSRKGQLDAARQLLEQTLRELDGVGNPDLEVRHLRSLALIWLADGDLVAAEQTVEKADRICHDAGLKDLANELLSIRGVIELEKGNLDEAYDLTATSAINVTPGVERPYLIHHRLSIAAEELAHYEVARIAAIEAKTLLDVSLAGLEAKHRSDAIAGVPEHLAIVERAQKFAPQILTVDLPSKKAPTGRALLDDEVVPVIWTVTHPKDGLLEDEVQQRRARVLRLLNEAEEQDATPSVKHLAAALKVSDTTIRRDIEALRGKGYPARTRGQRQTGT